jgi:NADPH:quinone reductase-like Zn-dependent oxidoreductase
MKALQFETFGTPWEVVREVDLPEPGAPGPGEVKVAIVAAPIHPSDLATTQGRTERARLRRRNRSAPKASCV